MQGQSTDLYDQSVVVDEAPRFILALERHVLKVDETDDLLLGLVQGSFPQLEGAFAVLFQVGLGEARGFRVRIRVGVVGEFQVVRVEHLVQEAKEFTQIVILATPLGKLFEK